MIKPESIRKVKETATILDVVSDYVSLRRQGTTFKGLCPFHNEKTPSFIVTPSKNLCKCFGCGKGGDPISFIMEIEHVNYPEAIRRLAQKYAIELEETEMSAEEKEQMSRLEVLGKATEWLQNVFASNLMTEEGRNVGMSYFLHRGLTEATIKKFGLGYALVDRHSYSARAEREGLLQQLIELGHISHGEYGTSDFYAARAIFPIHSISGKVIAFGARGIRQEDIDRGKYRNSPENELYKKNQVLYGLCFARNAIHKKEKAYISEGYLDVISMHQAGIENIVAPCGTALTEGQIRLLKRNIPSIGSTDSDEKFVTMLYDGDKAGRNAAIKNGKMLLAEGLNVKLILLPEGEDPDSFAQKNNADVIEKYLNENEQDYILYRANLLKTEAEGDPLKRATAIKTIAEVIAVIPDSVKRIEYAKACAKVLDTEHSIVQEYVGKERAKLAEAQAKEEAREAQRRLATSLQPQLPQTQIYTQPPQTQYYPQQQFPQYQQPYPAQPQQGYAQPLPTPQENIQQQPQQPYIDNGPIEMQVSAQEKGSDKFSREGLKTDLLRSEREIIELILKEGGRVILEMEEENEEQTEKIPVTVAEYFDYEFKEEEITLTHPIFKAMLEEAVSVVKENILGSTTLSDYFAKHENKEFNDVATSIAMDELYLKALMSKSCAEECDKKAIKDIITTICVLTRKFKICLLKERLEAITKEIEEAAKNDDSEKITELNKKMAETNDSIITLQVAQGCNNAISMGN